MVLLLKLLKNIFTNFDFGTSWYIDPRTDVIEVNFSEDMNLQINDDLITNDDALGENAKELYEKIVQKLK